MASNRGCVFPCFKDKVVIVTGASSGGIGECTAIEYAKDGAKLAITGLPCNAEQLNDTAKKCIAEGVTPEDIFQMTGDLTDVAFVETFIQQTVDKFGGIDVLVNIAGLSEAREPDEYDCDKLDRAYNLMVRAMYTIIRCSLPHLKKTKGSIVNISSIASLQPSAAVLEYSICKSSLAHMARNLAFEMAESGVRINTIAPGVIRTQMTESYGEGVFINGNKKTGFHRPGKPIEVASTIQFLTSPSASFITGVELPVDGGAAVLSFVNPSDFS